MTEFNNRIRYILRSRGHSKPQTYTFQQDEMTVIKDTFRRYGIDVSDILRTSNGFDVTLPNRGQGQLTDDIEYHSKHHSGPALKASIEIGHLTGYLLSDTRPMWKEGAPGGLESNIYLFRKQ